MIKRFKGAVSKQKYIDFIENFFLYNLYIFALYLNFIQTKLHRLYREKTIYLYIFVCM